MYQLLKKDKTLQYGEIYKWLKCSSCDRINAQLEMGLLFFAFRNANFLNKKKGQIKYNVLNTCNHEKIKEKQS